MDHEKISIVEICKFVIRDGKAELHNRKDAIYLSSIWDRFSDI